MLLDNVESRLQMEWSSWSADLKKKASIRLLGQTQQNLKVPFTTIEEDKSLNQGGDSMEEDPTRNRWHGRLKRLWPSENQQELGKKKRKKKANRFCQGNSEKQHKPPCQAVGFSPQRPILDVCAPEL